MKTAATLGIASLAGCLGGDESDEFPSEPMTHIVPFSEGGSADIYGRNLTEVIGENLDQEYRVENVPGGASLRGTQQLYNADPDGHTTGYVGSNPISWLVQEPDWDIRELKAVGAYSTVQWSLIANDDVAADLGLETTGDVFDAYNDGELEVISGQQEGGISHLAAMVIRNDSSYDVQWDRYVGYDGSGPLIQAVISGEVPIGISASGEVVPARSDLTVISSMPSGSNLYMDDVPSMVDDHGFPNIDFATRVPDALYAPPDTPDDIINTLTNSLESAIQSDEIQEFTSEMGWPADYIGPEIKEDHVDRILNELPQNVDLDEIR